MKKIFSISLLIFLFIFPCLGYALTCQDLNGAYLYSQDNIPKYLGFFGGSLASDSIYNTFGDYGSSFSELSVRNDFSDYGSGFSDLSCNNSFASKPPVIAKDGEIIGYLTVNTMISGGVALDTIDTLCQFSATAPITPRYSMTCQDLDGAYLFSQENPPVYLGFFGNEYASESIYNIYGTYGSCYNNLSVRNTYGTYGTEYGTYSHANKYASKPPVIVKNGQIIGYLTVNQFFAGGIPLRDIDIFCGSDFSASSPSTPSYLVAQFSCNPSSGGAPLSVQFTDLSAGNITSWKWDFDNDGIIDSIVRNPLYTYNSAGTYSAKLTIFDSSGNNDSYFQSITVLTETQPDLTVFKPSFWNDKLPVSTMQLLGTDIHNDTGPYYDNQILYLNIASINKGTEDSESYTVKIEITGVGGDMWTDTMPSTEVGNYYYYSSDKPFGPLSIGTHAIKMWVDYDGDIDESDETNNYYERTLLIYSRSDTCTWQGINSNWEDTANWDVGYPPFPRDTAVIAGSGATVAPVIDNGMATAKKVIIQSRSLMIENGGSLIIGTD